jgi:small nuclear ribonucleoprotein (snRNP)-like protein
MINEYLNKRVRIILLNGFAYLGLVVEENEDFLTIIDKNNRKVQVNRKSISCLEVQNVK